MMKKKELINELNILFGKNREKLRSRIIDACAEIDRYEEIGREISRKIRHPIRGGNMLFEETVEGVKSKKNDMFYIGDCSYRFEIVMSDGIKDGLDFDIELADSVKSGVKMCSLWVSMLMPYYAMDFRHMSYRKDVEEFFYVPHMSLTQKDQRFASKISDILNENGFELLSRPWAKTIVPNAITDVRGKGEASVFDCLFCDLDSYMDYSFRYNCHDGLTDELAGNVVSGTKTSWLEKLDMKGKVIERLLTHKYPSGDNVLTYFDNQNRIVKVIIQPKKKRMLEIDVVNMKLVK